MATDRKTGETETTKTHSARDVRQGEIVLRRYWQRIVFIGGLVALAVIAILASLFA